MKMTTNGPAPALPNGLVVVDKGGGAASQIQVGVLSGNRMPAFGVDVKGTAPNHYRVVEYGNFGVVIGTRSAVEVRVLLDNELMLETQLRPYAPPTGAHMDSRIKRIMSESPQPHFLMADAHGKPFKLAPHDPALSLDEIIAEQIHPGSFGLAPALESIDRAGEPRDEVKLDIDPTPYLPAPSAPPIPDGAPDLPAMGSGSPAPESSNLASASSTGSGSAANELPADLQELIPEHLRSGSAAGDSSSASEPESGKIETMDPTKPHRSWAPSHGLLAVGVRLLQTMGEGEQFPTRPDSFTYVLFQLNPWKIHSKMQGRLMGRIIIPSRDQMMKIMEAEGFGHELPKHSGVSCCMSGDHRHHNR